MMTNSIVMAEAIIRESWISMKANKLRTFLTMLGIVIGVCAVVIMVAAGQTVQKLINQQLAGVGSNMLVLQPEMTAQGGLRQGMSVIRTNDADVIKRVKHISAVAPSVNFSFMIVRGNSNYSAQVMGTTPEIMTINNFVVDKGAELTESDSRAGRTAALIGSTIARELFEEGEDPIGEVIRIRNVPFTVRGVLRPKGTAMGQDQDAIVIIPLNTLRRKLRGARIANQVMAVYIQVDHESNIERAKNLIEIALRESRRLRPDADNDFRIMDVTELLDTIRSVGVYLSLLLASIASISLFVGSIGIMNMMLVSVTERTREIGIRKAIGAPNSAIMGQFLLEAMLISFIGSMMGMLLGIGLSQGAGMIFETEVPFSTGTIVLSFVVAVVVGIASGLFPALKATRLDPIESLRYQ